MDETGAFQECQDIDSKDTTEEHIAAVEVENGDSTRAEDAGSTEAEQLQDNSDPTEEQVQAFNTTVFCGHFYQVSPPPPQNKKLRQHPLDLTFWSFLTFCTMV